MKKLMFAAAAAALLPLSAFADSAMTAQDPYARSANPKSGAVFMTLTNGGETACTLAGASTEVADRAELHTHREEDGMMKMVPADPIVIAPGESHALARGGDHVMLMGLKQPLENGQQVALTLDFGDCGKVDVTAGVDNDRAPETAPAHGADGGHGNAHGSHNAN